MSSSKNDTKKTGSDDTYQWTETIKPSMTFLFVHLAIFIGERHFFMVRFIIFILFYILYYFDLGPAY
jgi:hypothetical protein